MHFEIASTNKTKKAQASKCLGFFRLGYQPFVKSKYLSYRGKFLYSYSLSSDFLYDKYIQLFFIAFRNLK